MPRRLPDHVSDDEITIVARRVLLDALEALSAHRGAITLVGAQAVHLRTRAGGGTMTSYTTDADLTVDPAVLADEPRLERAMTDAGFVAGNNPGSWLRSSALGGRTEHIVVDLMVADTFSGPGSRRSGIIPPHGREATRRTAGLEPASIDADVMAVESLEPDADPRVAEVLVAGPAALLVAKAHKLGERARNASGARLVAKDAGDVFRIMNEVDVRDVARRTRRMLADPRSEAATRLGLAYLDELFGAPGRRGVVLAVEALSVDVDADLISTVAPAYVAAMRRGAEP